VLTTFLLWAFRAAYNLSLGSALSDGAFLETSTLFTSQAFGLVKEPVKALDKFRNRKTLIPGKTMSPPIDGQLFDILPYLREGIQKICPIQRTGIT
jgi:hypothetical protein